MSFWKIAWRNMQQRALASSLTGLSMALGVALMILVIVIHEVTVEQFSGDAQGYHFIVGGSKGGELELVMSTVFHLGRPLYPMRYSQYEKFLPGGEFASLVKLAVPYCLGDSYQSGGNSYRVVGTTPDLFDKLAYGANDDGTDKRYSFSAGHNFESDHFFEAVVGSVVARKARLKVGDSFQPTHGMSSDGHKHDGFKIVGILNPTGTANDRALFINIEGFYLLEGHALTSEKTMTLDGQIGSSLAEKIGAGQGDHLLLERASPSEDQPTVELHITGVSAEDAGDAMVVDLASATTSENTLPEHAEEDPYEEEVEHEHAASEVDGPNRGHEPLPEAQREVTAVLVVCRDDFSMMSLEQKVNKGGDRTIQAVMPARVVQSFLDNIVAPVQFVLLVLTVLIVVVAGVSILVSIYNSMSERSHDIAVMRALGASRPAVMAIIVFESILLSLLGGLAGVFLGHTFLAIVSPFVENETGITLHFWQFNQQELWLVPGLVAFATLVGFLPALTAYRTDVGRSLGGGR